MTDNGCYAGPNARFLAPGAPLRGAASGRFGNALSLSFLTHLVGGLCILLLAGRFSPSHDTVANLLQNVPYHLALIGPESSGGSGKATPTPARPLQRPGQDAIAIPSKARSDASALDRATPPELIEVPVVATTAGVQELPGVITAITAASLAPSDGTGIGGRTGSGRGPGNGPGDGLGPGGLGEGYVVGNGVVAPRLIREVKPSYTSEAMRARIQGTVRLQAIVSPDGSVSSARVIRSLDAVFGLDQEALKTIKQWRFVPGTLAGRAVPVLIDVELTFTLR
jgi:periplasmic protein TonB